MAFTLPTLQASPTFDGQTVPDSTDFAGICGTDDGNGVISGCAVTPHTGSDMNIAIAAGVVIINGQSVTVSAVTSLAVGAASTNDRRDIVVVNSSGVVSVTAGTACTVSGWSRTSTVLPPVKPAIPANSVILAEVYVAGTTTVIATGNIVDKTCLMTSGNYNAVALGGTVAFTTVTTILTTGTLGIGTWLIMAQCSAFSTTIGTAGFSIQMVVGTATATFVGPTASEAAQPVASDRMTANLAVIAIVTAAGTLIMKGKSPNSTTAQIADAEALGNPTGIVSIRIA